MQRDLRLPSHLGYGLKYGITPSRGLKHLHIIEEHIEISRVAVGLVASDVTLGL